MILSEEEVYNGAKRWLRKNGYQVLAGQPARGVDHLPVIEIKFPTREKGSKNAYKPDLVAFKDHYFFIVECKPEYSRDDHSKILDVLHSPQRLQSLYAELEQYQLLQRVDYAEPFEKFQTHVSGILAFSGAPHYDCDLHQLVVSDWKGTAKLI